MNDLREYHIEAIILPNGEGIDLATVRHSHFNPKLGALRFTYEVLNMVRPIDVDKISSRVRLIKTEAGRVAILCHRFFQQDDTIYIQDCDMRQINK